MKRRLLPAILAVLGIAAAAAAIAVAMDGGGEDDAAPGQNPQPRETLAPRGAPSVGTALDRDPHVPVPTLTSQPLRGRHFAILSVRDGTRVALYAKPGRQLLKWVGANSEFGSPRVLAVAAQKGAWLGVITPLRGNGELGWVRFDRGKLDLYWTRYSIKVLLSQRRMELRYGGEVVGRYVVTVGAAGLDTPQGRFSITDALDFGASPYYGCCALALSGRQDNLPVDWLGGDRLAIHGTPGPVGDAASHGCIRATDATMRTLFRRIPLGTPVFVRG
jgi:L,D-transpeptidase catalytic domain